MDEIPDDQEIVHVSHGMDHIQLIIQPFSQSSVVIRIPAGHPLIAQPVQVCPGIIPFRHVEPGQLGNPELDLHIASVGDPVGIVQSLLCIGKQSPHLLLRLAVVLAALVAHAVFICHLFIGLDAQKDVMGRRILCIRIVDVIGGHQIDVQLSGKS